MSRAREGGSGEAVGWARGKARACDAPRQAQGAAPCPPLALSRCVHSFAGSIPRAHEADYTGACTHERESTGVTQQVAIVCGARAADGVERLVLETEGEAESVPQRLLPGCDASPEGGSREGEGTAGRGWEDARGGGGGDVQELRPGAVEFAMSAAVLAASSNAGQDKDKDAAGGRVGGHEGGDASMTRSIHPQPHMHPCSAQHDLGALELPTQDGAAGGAGLAGDVAWCTPRRHANACMPHPYPPDIFTFRGIASPCAHNGQAGGEQERITSAARRGRLPGSVLAGGRARAQASSGGSGLAGGQSRLRSRSLSRNVTGADDDEAGDCRSLSSSWSRRTHAGRGGMVQAPSCTYTDAMRAYLRHPLLDLPLHSLASITSHLRPKSWSDMQGEVRATPCLPPRCLTPFSHRQPTPRPGTAPAPAPC